MYWTASRLDIEPASQFFEISAQVLPVVLLAAVIDVRRSRYLNSYQLALPIFVVFLGEMAALNILAFGENENGRHLQASATDFAIVAASLVSTVAALLFAVLADVEESASKGVPDAPQSSYLDRLALAVAKEWLAAVNSGNRQRMQELSAKDVNIIGPRGSAHGHEALAAWMCRAGFWAEAIRWFSGADGNVVVEQKGHWSNPASGAELSQAHIASHLVVSNGAVTCYQRHDSLAMALASAGLTIDNEVSTDLAR
jgi:hypothetical protein